jgi:hypothetical protein
MGGNQSLFTHHLTNTPSSTTYIYTRSNRFGAVESRRTVVSNYGITSTINFSDGMGYVDFLTYRGNRANNLSDYSQGGPQDGFNDGDYSHLLPSYVCNCGDNCRCVVL